MRTVFIMASVAAWLAPAGLLAQVNEGPITAPRINRDFIVGSILYPTIQSAVTAACALTNAQAVIPYTVAPSDTIAAVSGCSTVQIRDKRGVFDVFYQTTSTAYTQAFPAITASSITDNGTLAVAGATTLNGGTLNGSYAGSPTATGTWNFQLPPIFFSQSEQVFAGNLVTTSNNSRVSPGTSVPRGGIGWNWSASNGEIDLFTEYITGTGDAFAVWANASGGYAKLLSVDRSGTLSIANALNTAHVQNSTGIQVFSVASCTYTTTTIGGGCTQTVTMPVAEPDTNYRVFCVPVQTAGSTHCNNTFNKTTTTFQTGVIADSTSSNPSAASLDLLVIRN